MMSYVYGTLFFVSVISLIILIVKYKDCISRYYILLFCSTLLHCYGYWLLCGTDNLGEALIAQKVIYLTAGIIPFTMIMCIARLCQYTLPFKIKIMTMTLGAICIVGGASYEYTDLYYKNIKFIKENGCARLEKEYGFFHAIYYLYMVLFLVMGIYIVYASRTTKKKVSHVNCIILVVLMIAIIMVYVLERVRTLDYEWLPLALNVGLVGILIILRRIKLYDISNFTSTMLLENEEMDFILIDSSRRFIGAGALARKWFPELNLFEIDCKFPREGSDFVKCISEWIENKERGVYKHFDSDGKIIEVKYETIAEKKNKDLHCIILHDDTRDQQYKKLVEEYNNKLEQKVEEKTEQLMMIQNDIIVSMASIVENRDSNTGGHIKRTSDVVKIFVKYLLDNNICSELDRENAICIVKAAPLHDFGKIAIPDSILNKPGKIDENEYELMKEHSEKGAVIVQEILKNSQDVKFKEIAVNIAHYHHEKWNGEGYPKGLKEEAIPFEARVMALADVFDALVSKRVYKKSIGYDKAFEIIEESMGAHFEPRLCRAFLECRDKLIELYESYGLKKMETDEE